MCVCMYVYSIAMHYTHFNFTLIKYTVIVQCHINGVKLLYNNLHVIQSLYTLRYILLTILAYENTGNIIHLVVAKYAKITAEKSFTTCACSAA